MNKSVDIFGNFVVLSEYKATGYFTGYIKAERVIR